MRKIFSYLLAAAALAAAATPAAAQTAPTKVGYVNSQRIIGEAPGAKEAQQAFEKDMQRYQTELGQLEEQIKKTITEYEQKQATMTAQARQQQEEAIRQKQREFQQRAAQLEEQAAKRRQELVEPIMNRIQAVINEIRAEGKYAIIFDSSEGGIISADPSLDLTDQVLARLQASAAAKK